MLVSAAETMLQTSSNSLFAFVFCNLIVLVIFLGSKFGSTDSGTRDALPVFGIQYDVKQAEIVDVERFSSDQIARSSRLEKRGEEKLALSKVTEVCKGEMKPEEENEDIIIECTDDDENENENKEDDGEEVDEDEDNNGDDELRRRIEDFIAKVNREWEAENLKERMPQLIPLDSEDAPNKQMREIDPDETTSIFRLQSNFKF